MKKVALLIFMALSCCIFFIQPAKLPASNEFILLSVESGQSITQSLFFSVGSSKLKNSGHGDKIEDFKSQLTKNVQTFHDEFVISFLLAYNQNPKPEYAIGKGLIISKTGYHEKTDCVGFNIIYQTSEVWSYYHPSNEEEKDDVHYGFMITSSSNGQFPFAATLSSGQKVGERYKAAYEDALKTCNIEMEYAPDYVYDYATSSSYLKSDSEYKFQDANGLYHHTWMKKNLEGQNISLYTSVANRGLWYLTFTLVCLAGLGAAILIINRKKKTSIDKSGKV